MSFDSRLLSGIGVVVAVVAAGSFARAGEAMGLTQPAVSRAVARLEDRVGIRIFNRTARAISLTDEGRQFYEAVAPLLAGIEDAAVSAGKSKALVRGRLRVNVDGTFGHYVLAPRLGMFLDRYPELSVEVSVRDSMGDLVGEGIDVAVRFGAPEPSSLKARLLLETRVLTCASPAYVARHGAPMRPEDLRDGHQCLLIRDPATGRPFEWEFHRGADVVPLAAPGRLIVNDTGSLLGACLGGGGVAQLLEIYAQDLIAQGRLVHVLPDWADETFPLYAVYHSSTLVSAKVRAFLDLIRGLAS
ncbi:LysR family transcriptional regulator [Aquabacter spiritensis]|uniref:LysR family transcriptional regulator n=1 Tax=Aquabacter spiritensis TaxID=933073 RepID=A0A4R3LQ82_9HYPH|nr:LysR family transcriptional regulator [Aquabacter spiritensis]TCT01719.1 LysR family transcriptional regulator [Aquabacter spiritensis]